VASIRSIHNVWRDALIPASYRGVMFHVETSQRAGGRRTVVHQYPKRNTPYAEDMGREATKWTITGYLIHGDRAIGSVLAQVSRLNTALDADDAGTLIHPWLGTMLVMCDRWSYSDRRERGGYFEYEMSFVEAGSPALVGQSDAPTNLTGAATTAETTATNSIGAGLSSPNVPAAPAPGAGLSSPVG
jgi:prophage DNA circulation protein